LSTSPFFPNSLLRPSHTTCSRAPALLGHTFLICLFFSRRPDKTCGRPVSLYRRPASSDVLILPRKASRCPLKPFFLLSFTDQSGSRELVLAPRRMISREIWLWLKTFVDLLRIEFSSQFILPVKVSVSFLSVLCTLT